jgi:transcriptional repressor NrdR
MKCPYCGSTKSKVTNKRNSSDGIRRRRECLDCEKRYTTYEYLSKPEIYVVKKNNLREIFSEEKIQKGLDRAFEKRPISKEKISKIVEEIEEQIRNTGKKEISSKKIGEMVMRKLRKIDRVAYVRFMSVYREFKDVEEFKLQLEKIK